MAKPSERITSQEGRSGSFVDLLDFSEDTGEPIEATERAGDSKAVASEGSLLDTILPDFPSTTSLELRLGSTWLQTAAILLLSVAFIVLGISPSSLLPQWAQVVMMFAAAGLLLVFGEHLYRRSGTRMFGKGLVFGGVKIAYSGVWSLYFHFEIVGLTAFSAAFLLLLLSHYGIAYRYRSELLHSSAVLMGLSFVSIAFDADAFGQLRFLVLLMAVSAGSLFFAVYRESPTMLLAASVISSMWLVFHAAGNGIALFQVVFRPVEENAALAAAGLLHVLMYTGVTYYYRRSGWIIGMFLRERRPFRFRDISLLSILLAGVVLSAVTSGEGAPSALLFTVTVFLLWNFYLLDRDIVSLHFFERKAVVIPSFTTFLLVALALAGSGSSDFGAILLYGVSASLWAMLSLEIILGYRRLEDLMVFLSFLSLAVVLTAARFTGILDNTLFSVAATVFVIFTGLLSRKRDSTDFAVGNALFLMLWLAVVYAADLRELSWFSLAPYLAALATVLRVAWRFSGTEYFLSGYVRSFGHEFTDTLARWKLLSPFNICMMASGFVLIILLEGFESGAGALLYPVFAFSFATVYIMLKERAGRLALPLMLHFFGFLTAFSSPSSLVVLAVLLGFTAMQFIRSRHRYDSHLMIILLISAACLPLLRPAPGMSDDTAAPFFWILFAASVGLYFVFLPRFRFHLIMVMVIITELLGFYVTVQDRVLAEELLFTGLCGIYLLYSLSPWNLTDVVDREHFPFIRTALVVVFYSLVPIFYFTGALEGYTGWVFHLVFTLATGLNILARRRGIAIPGTHGAGENGPDGENKGSGLYTTLDYSLLVSPLPVALLSISVGAVPYIMILNVILCVVFLLEVMGKENFHYLFMTAASLLAAQHLLHTTGGVTRGFISTEPGALALDAAVALLAMYYLATYIPGITTTGKEWKWCTSVIVCILLVAASSSFGLLLLPVLFFIVSFYRKDLFTNLLATTLLVVTVSGAVNLLLRDWLPVIFVFIALAPLFGALLNEARYLGEPFSYGYATLSTVLMMATAWLLGDTFETSVAWSVFSGFAVSGGFYYEKRYMRYYGYMMMPLAMIKIGYDWVTLSVEERVIPMIVLAVMMGMASFFYLKKINASGNASTNTSGNVSKNTSGNVSKNTSGNVSKEPVREKGGDPERR